MAIHRSIFILILGVSFCGVALRASAQVHGFFVVGYVPHYRIAEIQPRQFKGVTDVVYFGIVPESDGGLPDPVIPPSALRKLQATKSATDCRLLICVGGWDRSAGFSALAADPATRKRFVANLASYCKANKLAGIDYDWEHPKDERETNLYRSLIAETCQQFHKHDLIVTVAQAPWQDLGKSTYGEIDRVHLMSYDHEFPQATLAKSLKDVEQLQARGCRAAKIALGIPFYGRNRQRESRAYRDLVAKDPKLESNDIAAGFAFNGPATVKAKTEYAREQKLAGVMVWELSQDASDDSKSLLKAIRQVREGAEFGDDR